MNDAVVLDASVIVKWVVAEAGADMASALLLEAERTFYAPAHAMAEVFEALMRKKRAGLISTEQLRDSARALTGVWTSVALDELIAPAVELADRLGISVYDALYPALALARDAILVTDDRRLAAAVRQAGDAGRVVLLSDIVAEGLAAAARS